MTEGRTIASGPASESRGGGGGTSAVLPWAVAFAVAAVAVAGVAADPAPQPSRRVERRIDGFRVLVDDRLLPGGSDEEVGGTAIDFLAARLRDIRIVVPLEKLEHLRKVTIVLDASCGTLQSMQYHPSADWLADHGYPRDLEKCVHLPCAADVATRRNVNEQPWCILHELAHAYHDQVLGFDEPRIREAWERYGAGGKGDRTLLVDGSRGRHYALTNQMEFFAEMSEAYFGSNDFQPFNRAELESDHPEIHALLVELWGSIRQ